MQAWETIQRVVDGIEAEEFSIGELAKAASLSPFYFQRMFALRQPKMGVASSIGL